MSNLQLFWEKRKEEIIPLYNGTILMFALFHYSEEDNIRTIKPIKLLRFKKDDDDFIILDFSQDGHDIFWGWVLCDYSDPDQKFKYCDIDDNGYIGGGYFCDGCEKAIICGYHCEKCNFDLCAECYEKNIEHEHKLSKVDKYFNINTFYRANCTEEFVVNSSEY